jgi:hypothetical protein
VEQISGSNDPKLCAVERETCEACCRSFAPSSDHINPVVASLLYKLADAACRGGDIPGCNRSRAVALRELALQNLIDADHLRSVAGDGSAVQRDDVAIDHILPRPSRRSGHGVARWSVGVTTAPRQESTLDHCLSSMTEAGWDQIRLFVDGDHPLPDRWSHLPVTRHSPPLGAWPNFYVALWELLLREPHADAILMVQDDALFLQHSGFRRYMEQILWPGRREGICSLFTSAAYSRSTAGWYRFRGVWKWGAVALVFSAGTARRFLTDSWVVGHRWRRRRNPLADIDWLVGAWAFRHRVPIYYPTPSLVQHIGHTSALWKNVPALGSRRADRFAGEM